MVTLPAVDAPRPLPAAALPRGGRRRTAGCCLALTLLLVLQACAAPRQTAAGPHGSSPQADLALTSSERVNLALKFEPRHPRLNFLNGLVYESRSAIGSEGRELARIGYQMASRLDPGFWPADYQLALLALEERQAAEAQLHLLSALQKAPDEARLWYALARASHCAGAVAIAAGALEQAQALQPADAVEAYETAALVSAARGDAVQSEHWARQFAAVAPARHAQELKRRSTELLRSAAASPAAAGGATPSAAAAAAAVPAASSASSPTPPAVAQARPRPQRHTAVVDVVILRRNELRSTSQGINLLDALKLQFGGSLLSTSWSRVTDRRLDTDTEDLVNRKRDLQLAIPTISYSLNIANAQSGGSTVEARPTLLISDGTLSKIFTGGTLTYASDGQLASNSFTKEVGLSLSVKPEFVSDDLVNLTVSTALEVFATTPSPGTFRQTLQTEKSATEISTDLRFGETVLIYGGKTTQADRSESKTPLLGDVPLLRHAFSARGGSESESGLLILLSLREREGADGGAARERAERQRIEQLAAQLLRGVGRDLAPQEGGRRFREPNHRLYQLANPGREFDARYLAGIGLDASLLADRRLPIPEKESAR